MTQHQLSARILHGGSIDPLALACMTRLIHTQPFVVRIVARTLGVIGGDYDTSEDAGKPHQ
ncbi:hypothetical protein AN189_17575 [Loktanella sp. 3ANDIMAR09]|uniref:hypothetical protein n=1 Tax=Loktanella sp. 3ANDIMAR09 TaxID=1225657 RepID=UPI0007015B20|nr:hypothetical protein [Loktanella sp. 3ANDIMAR09]KQI67034.1 hypothetical protein AN189_17575 [Loktanella sp. 3ANDIMAR09]